jgi:uncharacterized protein (TIGR03437 family)
MQVGLGAGGGAFVGADINEASGYEIYFGVQRAALGGSGIFLNPQGVVSAANFAPAGNPIAPGEFIALYGTGFAKSAQSAAAPYPPTLNGVTVLIDNKTAPLYYVGPGEIDCLVPYATQGPTATIVVQSGSASSNTVTVPVAPTAPGVFSVDQSGGGFGAILHADYSLVTSGKPAVAGETVLIYLTGMGAVSPPVLDGTAGKPSPSTSNTDLAMSQILVLVGGAQARVTYSGLAPGYSGLYRLNVRLPAILPGSGSLPLAISTPNAWHDQVDIAIGQ